MSLANLAVQAISQIDLNLKIEDTLPIFEALYSGVHRDKGLGGNRARHLELHELTFRNLPAIKSLCLGQSNSSQGAPVSMTFEYASGGITRKEYYTLAEFQADMAGNLPTYYPTLAIS